MDSIPGWVKVLVLLVVIVVTGGLIYKSATKDPWEARNREKREMEVQIAIRSTQTLREKGKQQFGRYLVEAKHVAGLEFADVTIRETKGDSVTQEIKAGRMTISYATKETTIAQLSDLTVTDYDEEGTASSYSNDTVMIYFTNGAGPTGLVGEDWADGETR